MGFGWAHLGTSVIASFLASLVECVEALTVILAVGSVRGWRSALYGTGSAIAVLLAIVAILGPALTRIPLHTIQIFVGILLLLFGLRWLRKAILRAAGLIPLHDETAAFAKNTVKLRGLSARVGALDKVAFSSAFNITMLEGTEVVFIVIAIGAGGHGIFSPPAPAPSPPCSPSPCLVSSSIARSPACPKTPSNSSSVFCSPLSAPSGSAKASISVGPKPTGPSSPSSPPIC